MRDKDTELLEEAYNNVLLNEFDLKKTLKTGAAAAGIMGSALFPNNAKASQPIQSANMSDYQAEQSVNNSPRLFESEEKLKSLVPLLQSLKPYFAENAANLPFEKRAELKNAVSKAYGITDPNDLFNVIKRDYAEFNHKNDVSETEDFVMTALGYFSRVFVPNIDQRTPSSPR
jgi:hypothetical protein